MPNPDVETISWLRLILAFSVITALLALLGFGLKWLSKKGIGGLATHKTEGGRLTIVESKTIDMHRRLVIVRCDGTEHLLLLGHDRDLVIQSGLNKDSHKAW